MTVRNALLDNFITSAIGGLGGLAIELANLLQKEPSLAVHILAVVVVFLGASAQDAIRMTWRKSSAPPPLDEAQPVTIADTITKAPGPIVLLCFLLSLTACPTVGRVAAGTTLDTGPIALGDGCSFRGVAGAIVVDADGHCVKPVSATLTCPGPVIVALPVYNVRYQGPNPTPPPDVCP